MSDWSDHIVPAFLLGAALGAAPGPVQLLILSETARGGLRRGLRVMLGANGALLAVMVALAFGFSALAPSEAVLRGLRIVGGGVPDLHRRGGAADAAGRGRRRRRSDAGPCPAPRSDPPPAASSR